MPLFNEAKLILKRILRHPLKVRSRFLKYVVDVARKVCIESGLCYRYEEECVRWCHLIQSKVSMNVR